MYNDEDISKQMEKFNKSERERLEETLEKIRCGECTTMNYYEVFTCYQILQNKKEYEAEIKKYGDLILQAAKTDSDQETANVCAANVYSYYKNKEQAIYHINKALSLNSGNAEFYMVRARIYHDFKMKKEAEADYAKASSLAPDMAETIELLKRTDKLQNTKPMLSWVIFIILLTIFSIAFILYDTLSGLH